MVNKKELIENYIKNGCTQEEAEKLSKKDRIEYYEKQGYNRLYAEAIVRAEDSNVKNGYFL